MNRGLHFGLVVFALLTEDAFADYLVVSKAARLRSEPLSKAGVVAFVQPGEALELLDSGDEHNGYYHVRTGSSDTGWIARSQARRRHGDLPPLSEGSAEEEPSAGDVSTANRLRIPLKCGTERWSVKTMSDEDVASLDLKQVKSTTIHVLNDLTPVCGLEPDHRTRDEEHRVYEVTGRVFVVKMEDDRDIHIGIEDPASRETMIVEVVDPTCPGASGSPYLEQLKLARHQFFDALGGGGLSALKGETVRVQGVGFFDKRHNQKGRSSSCLELHPVLKIERSPP